MSSKVLFVSVHNAARTHAAAAWFNALAHPEKAHAESAGTGAIGGVVHAGMVAAMKERGLDIAEARPRPFTPSLRDSAAFIIAIAPEPIDPSVFGDTPHDVWLMEECGAQSEAGVRALRDDVEKFVRRLLVDRRWMPFGASAPPASP